MKKLEWTLDTRISQKNIWFFSIPTYSLIYFLLYSLKYPNFQSHNNLLKSYDINMITHILTPSSAIK